MFGAIHKRLLFKKAAQSKKSLNQAEKVSIPKSWIVVDSLEELPRINFDEDYPHLEEALSILSLNHLPNIRTFKIYSSLQQDGAHLQYLYRINMPQLVQMDISGFNFKQKNPLNFERIFAKCKNIRVLKTTNSILDYIYSDGAESSLAHLALTKSKISNKSIRNLVAMKLPLLKSLNLDFCKIDISAFQQLRKLDTPQLHLLSLHGFQFGTLELIRFHHMKGKGSQFGSGPYLQFAFTKKIQELETQVKQLLSMTIENLTRGI